MLRLLPLRLLEGKAHEVKTRQRRLTDDVSKWFRTNLVEVFPTKAARGPGRAHREGTRLAEQVWMLARTSWHTSLRRETVRTPYSRRKFSASGMQLDRGPAQDIESRQQKRQPRLHMEGRLERL